MVRHLLWEQVEAGSIPVSPTINFQEVEKSGRSRCSWNAEVAGSNPAFLTIFMAWVVQLVERLIVSQVVAGSSPVSRPDGEVNSLSRSTI